MAYINDLALDAGLAYMITNGTRIDLCSSEPANYAGIAAVSLGNKTGLTLTAAANGTVSGRRTTTPAFTDGTTTASGSATHWALSNGSSVLVASNSLAASQALVSGNPCTLDAISITFPDAVSA